MKSYIGLDLSDAKGEVNIIGSDHNFEYIKSSNYGSVLTASKNGSTLEGGADDDKLYGGKGADVFVYKGGDGNDVIYNLNVNDTLSISGGSYSTTKNGSNVIVTADDGKISLIGAASLGSSLNISFEQIEVEENKWKLDGTTAKYGTASNTLITISNVKSLDGLSLSDKVVTVAKSSVNAKKITISGEGYTLKLATDVPKPLTKKEGRNIKDTVATYESSYKTAGYTLAKDSKSITYSKATTATTLATVKGAASTDGLSVSGKKITLEKSALNSKVTIGGSYNFNFASDYKKATITGSSKADTITMNGTKISVNAGKGNDSIISNSTGGNVFIYKNGDGSDVIENFAASDKIKIVNATADKVTTSGSDVVFTIGTGAIILKNAANKVVAYSDDGGEQKLSKRL